MNKRALLKAFAAAAVLPRSPAFAQTDPSKILVGFPAGTATDALARLLGDRMKGGYAPSLTVDNRVGVGGQLAVVAAKTAPANGTVMLVCPMTVLALSPFTFKKVEYDPEADLTPVGNCTTVDQAIAVGAAVPQSVKTVAQFLEWCKANPSKASFATGAVGSTLHFAGLQLGQEAGVTLTHVGYSNGGAAVTDLIGGSVPAYIGTVPTLLPFQDRLRILATMGAKRSQFLPNVPTLAESGYKNLVIEARIGLYLPARASQAQVQKLHAAMVAALANQESVRSLATLGMEAAPSSPAELAAELKAELAKWGPFVKRIGFKQDS